MGVITVGRDEIVVVPGRGKSAADDCFLTDVEMAKSADFLRLILLTGALLEAPDHQHQREHVDFVALLPRLHLGPAGRGITARARERSGLRPKFMQKTKSHV